MRWIWKFGKIFILTSDKQQGILFGGKFEFAKEISNFKIWHLDFNKSNLTIILLAKKPLLIMSNMNVIDLIS